MKTIQYDIYNDNKDLTKQSKDNVKFVQEKLDLLIYEIISNIKDETKVKITASLDAYTVLQLSNSNSNIISNFNYLAIIINGTNVVVHRDLYSVDNLGNENETYILITEEGEEEVKIVLNNLFR